jgi:hypothetical protein
MTASEYSGGRVGKFVDVGTHFFRKRHILAARTIAADSYLLIPEQVAHLFQNDVAHLFRLIVARHSD